MANLILERIKEEEAIRGYVNEDFKMSYKALQAIQWSDAYLNIYEGAVRSSKTVSANIAWYNFLSESPHQNFLMTGKTEATLYRNLIEGDYGLLGLYGESNIKWKKSQAGGTQLKVRVKEFGSGRLIWKTCYVIGANDQTAESKIRGMTIGGWYGDEVTVYPESVIKQGLLRMSLDGSRAFWTTNPDSPFHHIYTDYIAVAEEKGYRVFHFELTDNLALSPQYIETIKNAFTGVWYDRMVRGMWSVADGLIYPNFSMKDLSEGGNLVLDEATLPKMKAYFIGTDYGQANATVFLLVGHGIDDNYYVIDEYFHSGRDAEVSGKASKAPSDYARDYYSFATKRNERGTRKYLNIVRSYIDPSAKGFLRECQKYIKDTLNDTTMYSAFRHADNDVDTGMQTVSSLISNEDGENRRLFIVKDKCPHTTKEMGTYAWDTKAVLRTGKDKPMKINDHCMDALRYAIYNYEIYVHSQNKSNKRKSAKDQARKRRLGQ